MRLAWNHRWDLTPQQAILCQRRVRDRVLLPRDSPVPFRLPPLVMAVDVGYDRASDLCAAALVVWDVRAARVVDWRTHVQPSTFPYVPGLLSFREIPPLLPLLRALPDRPRLLICDGQGYAHPRRAGLASHLGVVLDCPTLGWAKSRLIGLHRRPGRLAGAAAPLMDGSEQIGWALRSRTDCRPTYVSPGHRLSLAQSVQVARDLLGRHRLCEPAREAHGLTRRLLVASKPAQN